jgi:hypothetical protein
MRISRLFIMDDLSCSRILPTGSALQLWLALSVGLVVLLSTGCDTLYRNLDEVALRQADAGADAELLDAADVADATDAADVRDAADVADDLDVSDVPDSEVDSSPGCQQLSDACECIDGATERCDVPQAQGVCAVGTRTCVEGGWSSCESDVMPSEEVCDGVDNDCDGATDDADDDVTDPTTWYRDEDEDGVGLASNTQTACTSPGPGWADRDGDCDAANPDVWDRCASCKDLDGDGHFVGCDAYVQNPPDCDDADPTRTIDCAAYATGAFGATVHAVAAEPLEWGAHVLAGGTIAAGSGALFGDATTQTVSSSNETAGFVASYTRNGELHWVEALQGSADEHVEDVASGPHGQVYAGGHFDGDLVFGEDRQSGVVLTATEAEDAFVASLSRYGDYDWIAHIDGSQEERVDAVAAGPNVVAAGTFKGDVNLHGSDFVSSFDSGTGGAATNGFVGSWTHGGDLQWATHLDSANSLEVADVAWIGAGRIAVVGTFNGTLSVDASSGSRSLTASSGEDGFLVVLEAATGQADWLELIDGQFGARVEAVGALGNDTIAVAGTYVGSLISPALADVDVNGPDIFVATYALSDARLGWSASAGGGSDETVEALATAGGEVAVLGSFEAPVTFGAGESNLTYLRPQSSRDAFVARYLPDGRLKWARSAPTDDDAQIAGDMAATAAGTLVVVGDLGQTTNFWSGSAAPQEVTMSGTTASYLALLGRSGAACGDMGGVASGAAWPMAGYCPTRRGLAPVVGPGARRTLSSVWTVDNASFSVSAGPVVDAAGNVYLTAADGALHMVSPTGVLDAASGFPFDSWTDNNSTGHDVYESTSSTPVIADGGTVFYGLKARQTITDPDNVAGVVAVSTAGIWEGFFGTATSREDVEPYNTVAQSAVIDGDKDLFFVSRSNDIHGVTNASTPFTGTLAGLPPAPPVDADASPALGFDGRLYVVLESAIDREFAAFDQQGNPLCASPVSLGAGVEVTADPVVGLDETVYIGTSAGELFAIDGRRCELLWSTNLDGEIRSRVAIDSDGFLYVGTIVDNGTTTAGHIYSLDPNDPDNATKRVHEVLSEGVVASPVVDAESNVYVGALDGNVYHIDREQADQVFVLYLFNQPSVVPIEQTAAFDHLGRLVVTAGESVHALAHPLP